MPALAQWIGADTRAHVLTDRDLRAHWMSPAAIRLMDGPKSVLVRNGRLHTRENRFDKQLQALVRSASAEISTCCIYDPKLGEHLVLTAVHVAPAMVGLTLHQATEDFPFRLADLNAAFGFTRTESRVAQNLICGRTAEETSEVLGISLETVRTHIKRAYAKLGVSSREAFLHRLAPFVIMLA